jgi:hypothetical protein
LSPPLAEAARQRSLLLLTSPSCAPFFFFRVLYISHVHSPNMDGVKQVDHPFVFLQMRPKGHGWKVLHCCPTGFWAQAEGRSASATNTTTTINGRRTSDRAASEKRGALRTCVVILPFFLFFGGGFLKKLGLRIREGEGKRELQSLVRYRRKKVRVSFCPPRPMRVSRDLFAPLSRRR